MVNKNTLFMRLWLPIIILVTLLSTIIFSYLPYFTKHFIFHNDAIVLDSAKNTFLGFGESDHLLRIGRVLNAVLMTIYTWFIQNSSNLVAARLFQLLCLLLGSGLIFWFLKKKCQWSFFWSTITTTAFLILPSSNLYTLWNAHTIAGPFNTLIAIYTYILIDRYRDDTKLIRSDSGLFYPWATWVNGFIFFLATLFIYPSTSMFVFVLSFALIIKYISKNRALALQIFIRDIVLFASAMGVYFWLNTKIVIPWVLNEAGYPSSGDRVYDMVLASNIMEKWPIVYQTLLTMLGNTWHGLWPQLSPWINGLVVVSALSLSLFKKRSLKKIFFTSGCVLVYLVLVNIPTWLSKGTTFFIGYRTFLAPMFLGTLWIMLSLQSVAKEKPQWNKIIKTIAVLWLLIGLLSNFQLTRQVIANQTQEYTTLANKIHELKNKPESNVLIIPRVIGQNYTGQSLPYEFNLMMSEWPHMKPLIEELVTPEILQGRNLRFFFVHPQQRQQAYQTKNVAIIDLNESN